MAELRCPKCGVRFSSNDELMKHSKKRHGPIAASIFREPLFWISISLVVLTGFFFAGTILDWFDFGFEWGGYRINHWLGWIGFLFILIHVPSFLFLKTRYGNKMRMLLGIHVFGDLLAFLLISIHFASQITRPAQFYPDLGTGMALYFLMITIVPTGFLQRFNFMNRFKKSWRFLHRSSVFGLLIIISIHILHGINMI